MLKQIRKQVQLSQEEFAEELGISVRHLQRLEKDDHNIKLSTFKKMVKSFAVPDEEILNFIKK
mgnify:CR=1 FL=1